MNIVNGNMIARAICILRKATCKRNNEAFAIVQNNVHLLTISRNKATREIFETVPKQYQRTIVKKKQINISEYLLLAIPIVTFGLGTWQIFRYLDKLELINKLTSRTVQNPIEFPENLDDLRSKEYYPVRVRGEFLHDKEFLIGPRASVSNQPKGDLAFNRSAGAGFLVITPFKIENQDITILVNRGWVPSALKHPSRRKEGQVEGIVEVVGLVRFGEKRVVFGAKNRPSTNTWIYKDYNTMAEMAGAEPLCLDVVMKNTIRGGPIGGQTQINLPNNHVSYIITWYLLSACTLYTWYKSRHLRRA